MRVRDFEHVDKKHRRHPNVSFMKPVRATEKSCGYDVFSPINVTIAPNDISVVWTDVKAYMEDDEVLEANTRSGNGIKKQIVLANVIGWIDSDYYCNPSNDGNIGIALKNTSKEYVDFKKGDRIAQLKFSKYLITDTDNPTSKQRIGGIGSTNE